MRCSSRQALRASTDTPKPRRTRSLMEAMESISRVMLKSLMFRFWLSRLASKRSRVLELGRRRISRSFFNWLTVTMLCPARLCSGATASTRQSVSSIM